MNGYDLVLFNYLYRFEAGYTEPVRFARRPWGLHDELERIRHQGNLWEAATRDNP